MRCAKILQKDVENKMKRRLSLFRNLNPKFSEETSVFLNGSMHKVLKLNLKKRTYEEIFVLPEERFPDKGYSHKLSDWIVNFAMTGNIHKDDIQSYLDFLNIEKLKIEFSQDVKKRSIRYRRNTHNEMRWVELDLIPVPNFSEKNQIVYLYTYDIHDSMSEELKTTKIMTSVAHSITKSFLCSVYLDLDHDTSKVIYANDLVKPYLDSSIPMRTFLKKSVEYFTSQAYMERMKDFCDLETLQDRLQGKDVINMEYIGNKGGVCRAIFYPVIYHRDGRLKSVIYANQYVEGELIKLRGQLETEKTLVECLTALSGTSDFDAATNKLLKSICNFYDGDRSYIFSINHQRQIAKNDYEWCRDTIAPKIDTHQNLPLSSITRLFDIMKTKDNVITTSRDDFAPDSIDAKLLDTYNITKFITVPFKNPDGTITGFLGIDNPKKNPDSEIVLRSAATYIQEEQIKQNYTKKLYELSYSDSMTKTYNRAAYIRDMELLAKETNHPAGILYADVNGLKTTNDTKGHEAGDKLISDAVALLRKYFNRKDDRIYRIGGDEFVVLSSDLFQKEFMTRVSNLKDELEHNWILSCGGKWFEGISDIDTSTKEAEKSMYKNKSDYYTAHPRTDRRQ